MSDLSPFNSINTSDQFDYKPSKVVSLFLIQFDIKFGYKLTWSKSLIDAFNFDGLDYKVLPSGIHEFKESTVLITHSFNNKMYYGLGRFHQQVQNDNEESESSEINRENVRMYTLGVLCEPYANLWKPNEFIQNGWEYIDILDSALLKFIDGKQTDNYESLDVLFNSLTNTLSPYLVGNIDNHLLNKLPALFETLGPLIFVVYKQSLLRKRILIFNSSISKAGNFTSGSFTYLISLLSIIPKDIETISKDEKNNYFSQPIYNIGLNDLNTSLVKLHSYIGSTNDDILMYQNDLFDLGILLPSHLNDNTVVLSSGSIVSGAPDFNQRIKSTRKDYNKFKSVYKELFHQKCFKKNSSPLDDLASIKTSNSILSYFRSEEIEKDPEPSWWIQSATSSISWREYIWSAFAWFASAGQVSDNSNLESNEPQNSETNSNQRLLLIQLVNIIGYFHKLTKKWFYLINEIVLEELEDQKIDNNYPANEDDDLNSSLLSSLTSNNKINIELTYQDITDMELDPYSEHDLQFVKDFVLLYWGSIVDNVDIGIGISGICC